MAVEAGRKAIADAGLSEADIDLLILGTMSPDYNFPSTACLVQAKLGLGNIPSFDVHAACSGFLYTLEVGTRMLQSGNYKHALIIGSEKMSSILDWEDRETCVLFGDGAGAAVLSCSETPDIGIIDNILAVDGSNPDLLYTPAGGSVQAIDAEALAQRDNFLKMKGKEVFKSAVRRMAEISDKILEQNNISVNDIACIIPHQANIRIIDSLAKHMGVPTDKCFLNIDRYGNTSAASIPIALHEAKNSNRFKKGDYILLVAFGAGLTWAASLIKWHT